MPLLRSSLLISPVLQAPAFRIWVHATNQRKKRRKKRAPIINHFPSQNQAFKFFQRKRYRASPSIKKEVEKLSLVIFGSLSNFSIFRPFSRFASSHPFFIEPKLLQLVPPFRIRIIL